MTSADVATQQDAGAADAQPAVRSGVRIEMNAKGLGQIKVSVYEGTPDAEMQRLKDLAIQTYQATIREMNAPTATV